MAGVLQSSLCTLLLTASWAAGARAEGVYELRGREAGLEYAQDFASSKVEHSLLFFQENHAWSPSTDAAALRLHLQYKLIVDSQRNKTLDGPDEDNVEKLVAYAEKPWGDWKFSLGLQEVTWGENLLLPILDVVNPRNVDYIRGFYDPGAKQSSPMLLSEWRSDIFEAQLIAVPWAVKSRQPESIGDFKIYDNRHYEAGSDGEYGGRLGMLSGGIDTKLYYFNHHPREPAYRFQAFSGDTDITLDDKMVETTGMSVSYAASSWLLRGDVARHRGFPATSVAAKVERTNLSQSILGMSWTTDDGQQTLGVELHNDLWDELPQVYGNGPWAQPESQPTLLSWVGATANLSLFQGLVDPQVFFLQGVDNRDRLLRFILLSHIDDHVNIGAEYQTTTSTTTSPKVLLSNKETLSLRIAYSW